MRHKKVDIKDIESFKYKHIQKDEGLRYVSNDGNAVGSKETNMDEVMEVIDKAYEYLCSLEENKTN